MRAVRGSLLVLLLVTAIPLALAADPQQDGKHRSPFNTEIFRPQVVLHELPLVTDAAFVTVTGVVFSHAPIDRVTVGERTALLRPAEPKDLVKLAKVPPGATDAPFRTYFEVPDAGLPRIGANDLVIRAVGTDGRVSDLHRVTVVRTTTKPENDQ